MNTIVVIGSNCFTGSHIVKALLEDPGFFVIGTSRSPEYKSLFLPYKNMDVSRFRFCQIDSVKEFEKLQILLEEQKPSVVINVAALSEVELSNEQPLEYYEINTIAVVKLCQFLRQKKWLEQYVHISSAEVFGNCSKPMNETDLFNPSTPYAASKAAADQFINTLIKNHNFPALIIRSTNVYGKHQQLFKIIPRTVIFLRQGKIIELHGGGKAVKSFIHIEDVVNGLVKAIKQRAIGTFHFSVPSEQTIVEIVEAICRKACFDPVKTTKAVGERLGQDTKYSLDCTKAQQLLSWKPRVSLQEGIAETINWIESFWEFIQKEPLVYIHKK